MNGRIAIGIVILGMAAALTACAPAGSPGDAAVADAPSETAEAPSAEANTAPGQDTTAGEDAVTAASAAAGDEPVSEATSALAALVPTPTGETQAPQTGGEAQSEPTDWRNTTTVDGDYIVLGNPAAPIRLIDYSDFM